MTPYFVAWLVSYICCEKKRQSTFWFIELAYIYIEHKIYQNKSRSLIHIYVYFPNCTVKWRDFGRFLNIFLYISTYFFFTAIWNDSEMKICHTFNVKLFTSLPKKSQQVLSHKSQLGGKNICGSWVWRH